MSDNSTRGRRLVSKERHPGRNFDVYEGQEYKQIHVDGSLGVAIGPIQSRIEFFQVEGTDSSNSEEGQFVEIRDRSLTVVIPTIAFVELMVNAFQGFRSNEKAITLAMEGLAPQLRVLLQSIEAPDAKK